MTAPPARSERTTAMLLPFQIETDEPLPYRQRRGWTVYALIVLCGLVHFWLFSSLSPSVRQGIFYRFGAVRFHFRPWTPLTCTFLHGSMGHIVGNLLVLWIYGREVERFVGSVRFIVLYLVGAYVSISVHLLTLSPMFIDEPVIGASGAIAAVLGAFLIFWPVAKLRCLFFSLVSFRPIIIQLPAFIVLGLWFAGQLLASLKITGAVGNIAFWAHAAGFGAGAGVAFLYQRFARKRDVDEELALRQPVVDAWRALARGDRAAAGACCDEAAEAGVDDCRGCRDFILGSVGVEAGDEDAAARLVRAFCQARDYRQDALVLSVYAAIRRFLDPATIPSFVHRDAGFAAFALKHRGLAMQAFRDALDGGCVEGLDPLFRAVKATLAPSLPAAAD